MNATDRPHVPFLDLPRQHQPLRDDLLRAVAELLDSCAFVGGAAVESFERAFADYTGTAHAVGVSNGSDGLRLALLALGVGAGQRVVTVPNSFVATATAITQAGASLDFVDVDPDTCLMDPNRLADLLRERFASPRREERPNAVVPVHLYGQCADMDAILELAGRYELVVLEDAAQAHGARYRGRPAGSLGDAAAFSFYPGKNLGACGDAGAVTTSKPEIADAMRELRDHGQKQKYVHLRQGYNARLDAMQAAFLLVKLRHLDGWNAGRRRIASMYDDALAGQAALVPVHVGPHNDSARHLYVVHAADRESLRSSLAARRISCGLHYPTPLHRQPCFDGLAYRGGDFPMAEWSAAHLLSLPLYPEMDAAQVQHVIDATAAWVAANPDMRLNPRPGQTGGRQGVDFHPVRGGQRCA